MLPVATASDLPVGDVKSGEEGAGAMALVVVSPASMHRHTADSKLVGKRSRAPVGAALGKLAQGYGDDVLDEGVVVSGLTATGPPASSRPATPASANRSLHFNTLGLEQPASLAITSLARPAAASRTIPARCTSHEARCDAETDQPSKYFCYETLQLGPCYRLPL